MSINKTNVISVTIFGYSISRTPNISIYQIKRSRNSTIRGGKWESMTFAKLTCRTNLKLSFLGIELYN